MMGQTKETKPKISIFDDKITSGCDAAKWKEHKKAYPQIEVKIHKHSLTSLGLARGSGWSCNGSLESDGCKSGMKGFKMSEGKNRYRCFTCDFDLCQKCVEY